jgi:hypothetical protein
MSSSNRQPFDFKPKATTSHSSNLGTVYPSGHSPSNPSSPTRTNIQHNEGLPAYTPSTLPQPSSRHQSSTPSRTRTAATARVDPQAPATAALNLSRAAPTPTSRKHQRPWTPREFAFISTIPQPSRHKTSKPVNSNSKINSSGHQPKDS